MRLVGLTIASLMLAATAPASAQYAPRPPAAIGPATAQDVSDIAQAMGLDPIGPAMPNGPFLVQRASDDFGRVLRVTVDPRRSQVVSVEADGAHGGYATYQRPPAGYVAMAPGGDGLAAPGSVMAPRPQPGAPPQHQATVTPNVTMPPLPPHTAPKPKIKSATATPQAAPTPPTPRKRPSAAPQETAGSIEPVAPAPAPAASPAAASAPAAVAPAAPSQPSATPPAQTLE